MSLKSKKNLPPPADRIRAGYRQLVAEIDARGKRLFEERYAAVIKCRPGCSECCIKFSVLPLEAALIAERLRMVQVHLLDDDNCPFLHNDICLIYENRPIICRTQGLPIGYIDEMAGTIEVSACALNFTAEYQIAQEDIFYMDQFNQQLTELNLEYSNSAGLHPIQRIALIDLAKAL